MRFALPLLVLTALACSSDATGPENNTGIEMEVPTGTVYAGFPWTVTVTNTTTSTVNIRALDCGTQVEKQEGSGWVSYVPTGTVCNYYGLPAGASQTFTLNMPTTGGAGTYRAVSSVQSGSSETSIYSATFSATTAPFCDDTHPPPCTPR